MVFIGMVEIIVHVLTLKTMRTKHIKNDVLFKMFCYHVKYMNYNSAQLGVRTFKCTCSLLLYNAHFYGFFFLH